MNTIRTNSVKSRDEIAYRSIEGGHRSGVMSRFEPRGSNLHMHILVKTPEMNKSAVKVKSSTTRKGNRTETPA
jgi:hypothetical protein